MSQAKNSDSTTPFVTPAGSAACNPLKELGRRELLRGGGVAALAMAGTAALSLPAVADYGNLDHGDAELRHLWSQYLAALQALRAAELVYRPAREPYEAEFDLRKHEYEHELGYGELHSILWEKHGLEQLSRAVTREHRKLIKITRAIRRARAETMFGVGVKLSASECFDEYDVVQAAEDARRAIAALTGVDFIAAAGPLAEA
jgi:hypothetical protein